MPLATPDDAIREFAWNAGSILKDQEWMLHDWDIWVKNPHYTGEPGPHPEDDDGTWEDYEGADNPNIGAFPDDIPF